MKLVNASTESKERPTFVSIWVKPAASAEWILQDNYPEDFVWLLYGLRHGETERLDQKYLGVFKLGVNPNSISNHSTNFKSK